MNKLAYVLKNWNDRSFLDGYNSMEYNYNGDFF